MNKELELKANKIKEFLDDNKCLDTVVIDLGEECSFASYFVIGTVTSLGHLRGVARQLWGELIDLGLEVNNRHKTPGEDGWELIDTGAIVVHLMSEELRTFYSLEKLWKKVEADR